MSALVNFLPWRQQRRRACLRFWCGVYGLSTVLVLLVILGGHIILCVDKQVDTVLLLAEQRLAQTLTTIKPRLEARQRQIQQAAQQEKLRQQTHRWQSALENLASGLPEQVWLTQMDYQQSALELTGKALSLTALTTLETTLRNSPEFEINHTGATRQDNQGNWQFHYRLAWREAHESSR